MAEPSTQRTTNEIMADLFEWMGNYFGNPPTFVNLCQELAASMPAPSSAATQKATTHSGTLGKSGDVSLK